MKGEFMGNNDLIIKVQAVLDEKESIQNIEKSLSSTMEKIQPKLKDLSVFFKNAILYEISNSSLKDVGRANYTVVPQL